jgi:hypothetical protein
MARMVWRITEGSVGLASLSDKSLGSRIFIWPVNLVNISGYDRQTGVSPISSCFREYIFLKEFQALSDVDGLKSE